MVEYYRAIGLLEVNQPDEALLAIERERELLGEDQFHVMTIRGCGQAALGEKTAARATLASILEVPLYDVNFLSMQGISSLLIRAYEAAKMLLEDEELTQAFENRLLQAYLAPESIFEAARKTGEQTDVKFYQVVIRQTLDESWMKFVGRLAHEKESDSYLGSWGVLASDDDDAQRRVLQWQERCYSPAAEIVECTASDDVYMDIPGVVWQGQRFMPNDDLDPFTSDNDFDDFDDDFDEE